MQRSYLLLANVTLKLLWLMAGAMSFQIPIPKERFTAFKTSEITGKHPIIFPCEKQCQRWPLTEIFPGPNGAECAQ